MKIVCFILILLLMTDQAQGSSSLLWSRIHRSTELTKDDEWIDEALSTEDVEESNAGNPDADVPAPDTPVEESDVDTPTAGIPIEETMSVDMQILEPSESQESQDVSEEIEMSDTPASPDNQKRLQEILEDIPQEILGIPEIQITDSGRDGPAITTGD